MKIQQKDFYYGVVLSQIAEFPVFTSVNKVDHKEGLYLINDVNKLLIKYSTGEGPTWTFNFREDDLDLGSGCWQFFALVCGEESICLLSEQEVSELIRPTKKASHWITVSCHSGGQMHVRGSLGALPRAVPHNAFPRDLLGGPRNKDQESYAWPPLSRINVYKEPPMTCACSTENRMLDLADLLGREVSFDDGVTAYFGISTPSYEWDIWNEKRLKRIEAQIKYDLEFDGFKVKINRHTNPIDPHTKKKDRLCSDEFVWKLDVTAA